jgi:tetratricopeptide (TPR) repeat protein
MSDDIFKLDLNFGFDGDTSTGEDRRLATALELMAQERATEALDLVEAVKREQGATPLIRHVVALAVARLGRLAPAVRLVREAHEEAPEAWEHAEVLASLLAHMGNRVDSVYYAKLSTALKPAYPDLDLVPKWLISFGVALMFAEENPLIDNGYLLMRDGALDLAAENFIDALELDSSVVEAWSGLVEVNRRRRRPGESHKAAEALAALKGDADSLLLLARSEVDLGRVERAWESVSEAVAMAGRDAAVASALPGLARYEHNPAPGLARDLAGAWRGLADVAPVPITVSPRPDDNARFRIGVLSGSIQSGSERSPMLSTIEECIGRAADLHYYTNLDTGDAVANRLRRSAMRWRDISKVDDDTVARMMVNDEIQILIDLDGFGFTGRPGIVARHPAAVVLSAFAEPGATAGGLALGEPNMPGFDADHPDAVVVDASLSTWPLYVKSSEIGAPSAEGPARILIDAPSARLSTGFLSVLADAVRAGMVGTLTLRGDSLADRSATEILAERFKAVGIDLDTVARHGADTPLESLLSDADLLLDTEPVPAVEAAFLALRQGVPVLTARPASPVNAAVTSLLSSLDLDDWIMEDTAALARRLAVLSADPAGLRAERARVRDAVSKAATLEVRIERGRAFAALFDRLLAEAAKRA